MFKHESIISCSNNKCSSYINETCCISYGECDDRIITALTPEETVQYEYIVRS